MTLYLWLSMYHIGLRRSLRPHVPFLAGDTVSLISRNSGLMAMLGYPIGTLTFCENWQCPSSYRCGNLGHVWNLTFGTRRKNASWDKLENQWLMNFGKVCTFLFSVSRFPFAFPFPGLSLPLCFVPVLEFHFSILYVFPCLCGSDLANDYLCIQMVRVLLLEAWNFGIQSCLNGGTCFAGMLVVYGYGILLPTKSGTFRNFVV